jgi:hypothetical protein
VKVYVLVEGASEKALLDRWAPRAFPGHQFLLRPHQGIGELPTGTGRPDPRRRGLLDLLPATLRGYASSNAPDEAVLVLIDADANHCVTLKQKLVKLAKKVCPQLRVVFRIAVEETEAFYFGDLRALQAAFPDADMDRARAFEPDSIPPNGTAEEFAEVVGEGTPRKVDWAEKMGGRLTTKPAESRSPSFRALHAGIVKLLQVPVPPRRQPKKPWKTRHSSLRKQKHKPKRK